MEYEHRNSARALGEHFTRHLSAMTAEQLHDKGEIACELAWRDSEIERLHQLLTNAGLIAAQEQHTALRTELAQCMVLLDQAYKALKYHREQTRPIHESDEAIAAIEAARKGEEG